MEVILIFIIISIAFYIFVNGSDGVKKEQQKIIKMQNIKNENRNNQNEPIKCPKCCSTQISANKRGVTVTTGLIGSQNVYITCLQCAHRWKAGA
ncbi:MAG: hypothetical protein LBE23_05955 [Vagococcus sp.]|jgi:RNase P subunit RPR2|nr:hypothetical protein [Vagococcus sp.]